MGICLLRSILDYEIVTVLKASSEAVLHKQCKSAQCKKIIEFGISQLLLSWVDEVLQLAI